MQGLELDPRRGAGGPSSAANHSNVARQQSLAAFTQQDSIGDPAAMAGAALLGEAGLGGASPNAPSNHALARGESGGVSRHSIARRRSSTHSDVPVHSVLQVFF